MANIEEEHFDESIIFEEGRDPHITQRPITRDIRSYLQTRKVPVVKYAPDGKLQRRFDMATLIFLSRCNLPFNLVDSPGFAEYINLLDPRMNIKGRQTIKSRLNLAYENVKKNFNKHLQKDFPHQEGICLTTDGWTSRSYDPYQGFTVHYVDKDFVMQKFMLDMQLFEGSHTGQQVANLIDKCVDNLRELDLSVDAEVAVVTDSAPNMLKATRISKRTTAPVECFAHKIHKSLEHAGKLPSVVEVFESVKALTSFLHKSTLAYQSVKRACEFLTSEYFSLKAMQFEVKLS